MPPGPPPRSRYCPVAVITNPGFLAAVWSSPGCSAAVPATPVAVSCAGAELDVEHRLRPDDQPLFVQSKCSFRLDDILHILV